MAPSPEPATGPSPDTAAFSAGLLDPERAKPGQVTGPRGKAAEKRYNVYRNNVTVSLIEALADIFPAVQKLTGENFFQTMAREFVRAHPPSSKLVFEYGHGFADFIDGFGPARSVPYLGDVARAERAWLSAYHAADVNPLDPANLAAIPADRVAGARFVMHPAFAVIASNYPLFRIFSMNRDLMPFEAVDMAEAEAVLITRPASEVRITHIAAGTAIFMQALEKGQTLGAAAGAALEADDTFDLNAALTTLLSTGACASVAVADDGEGT